MTELRAFVLQHTQLETPVLIPEISLQLATDVTTLWQAAEQRWGPQEPPFWGFVWPGSQALARWIFDHRKEIVGRSVLDVGSGNGLAAIAAKKAGASFVIANDIQPLAAASIAVNAAKNNVSLDIVCADLLGTEIDAEVVLVGDLCYDKSTSDRLFPWLRGLARTRRVLLAEPGRAFAPREGIHRIATYTVPTLPDLESRSERDVVLLEVLPS